MSDPKFGGAARVCKRSRAEVLFVWGCLLESCAEANSETYSFDADAVADLLDIDTEHAQSIHDALVQKGLLDDGKVVSWGRRQFTSDDSSKRVREHRQRRKTVTNEVGNVDETLHVTDVTPPYTETDTDTTTTAKAIVVVAPKSAPKPKGSRRCPNSWMPSDTDIAVAKREGFTPGEIERELSMIRDHEFRDAHAD